MVFLSFFLPPCLALLWATIRFPWPGTALPVKEVRSLLCAVGRMGRRSMGDPGQTPWMPFLTQGMGLERDEPVRASLSAGGSQISMFLRTDMDLKCRPLTRQYS